MSFCYIDYLGAKKSVDDRALNRHVLLNLIQHLPPTNEDTPLLVLDIGAGIGTMLERLVEWHVLGDAVYTAVDLRPDLINEASRRLPVWAEGQGFSTRRTAENSLVLERKGREITVILEAIDIFDFVARERRGRRWDLLIANAFLDLVNPPALLPDLFSVLKPKGLAYFTLNFDGETILLPETDPDLDREIIRLYHLDMDNKRVNGQTTCGSECGRRLFGHLKSAGAEIIDAGSSDWVVFAGRDGYPADEAFFLHCIVDTIQAAIQDQVPFDIQPWIEQRHEQIRGQELFYIAHQIDFLGTVS